MNGGATHEGLESGAIGPVSAVSLRAIRQLADPDAIIAALRDGLVERLGIRHVVYGDMVQGDPSTLKMVDGGAPFADLLRVLLAGRAWSGPRIVADDGEWDEGTDPVLEALHRTGARSGLLLPVRKNGGLVGAMAVLHDGPRSWTQGQIALCEDVAERIWSAAARARAEQELRERERSQSFILDWSDKVRALATPDAIMAATLECIGRHLNVTRATYSEADATGRIFTVRGEWREASVMSIANTSFSLDDVGRVVDREWTSGAVVRYDDIATDPRIEPEVVDSYLLPQIRSFVSVPLLFDGRVQCALSVQHWQARPWRDSEIAMLREIAERTWVSLGRARAQAELEERERHQAFLIAWTDRLRGETEPGTILSVTLEWLGGHLGVTRVTYARGDEAGPSFTIIDEWRDGVGSMIGNRFTPGSFGSMRDRAAWNGGALVRFDDIANDPVVGPEATERYARSQIAAFVSAPAIQDGMIRSILSVQHREARNWRKGEVELIQDIAQRVWATMERARIQAALKEREQYQAFLLDWSDRLRGETAPLGMVDVTLQRLLHHLGATRTNFAERTGAGYFTITREWRAGVEGGSAPVREGVSDGVHQAYLAGEVVIVEDVETDPRFDEGMRDIYTYLDAVAFLGIPLVREGQVRAVLSVQQARPRRWLRHEVQLLSDISDRMWVSLERARAAAELAVRERNQAFLIEWSDDIQGENDARTILSRTLGRLGRHLGTMRTNYAEATDRGETLWVSDEWRSDGPAVQGDRYPLAVLGDRLAAAHRAGQAIRVNDIADDPLFDESNRPLFEALGIGAVMTLPMVRGGEIVAVLSVQHAAPHVWSDAEFELVREVAHRTLAILERAQSEARLAESEAQLSVFMENAPLVMHLKDAEGRYMRINPEFARAMRRPVEDLIDRHPTEIFPAHIAAQIEAVEQRARAGEVASAELEVKLGDTYQTVLSIIFPVPGATGRARTAGFAIDLTERKRAEAALAHSREKLFQTEKLSALGSLLAGVSHELNNPLSIVVAQAVMMERQANGTDLAKRAQKIRNAADRCARIVQTFLAMARQKQPVRAAVDLNAVALGACELASYGLRTDGIAAERDLGVGLPVISADADQLHQIIINLLVNAQQAMVDAGTADRRITLRTRVGDVAGTVVLEVADTGPGIPEDARRRVFEPFFTTKPQGQGTGVGLSFSKGLAEAHGGQLELVRSASGACFRLTLPVDPDGIVAAAPEALAVEVASPRLRALVIDDEEEIAEALADFLSLEGYACDVAVGGVAGRERLARDHYDLVVSDLRMPDMDGPQLYAWLAAERPEMVGRMAFTTGDTLGLHAARFLDEVKRPVLEKPFTPEAVARFLEQLDKA
ncbi:MAG: GAF domain-containing protein [Sphingobium sp.]